MDAEERNAAPRPLFRDIGSITIFENDDLIVLNKPSGLLSIPDRTQSAPSLKDYLIEKFRRIYTVHRLDRGTSGVIVFAKNEEAHRFLSLQFEERQTRKIYQGLVIGKPSPPSATIDEPIAEHFAKKGVMMIHAEGKAAITNYAVAEQFRSYAWAEFSILTGRTHQIRVHMKHAGNPLACDELYGDGLPIKLSTFKKKFNLAKADDEERPLLNRLALHASSLTFRLNDTETATYAAELPKDLRALLKQLQKWNS